MHALMIIGWYELPEEDQPAAHLWLDDEALHEHFERVHERRNTRTSSDLESVPQPELEQNELTAQYRKK